MTADPTEVGVLGLGIGGVLALYGLRRVLLASRQAGQIHSWVLISLLDVRNTCGLAGILLGLSLPPALRGDLEEVMLVAVSLLAGWVGFASGCAMDLRVLRRHPPTVLLMDVAQAGGVVAVILLAAYAVAQIPLGGPNLWNGTTLFMACALAVAAAPPLLGSLVREPKGGKRGFWKPSLAALLAIVLVAVGSGQLPAKTLALGHRLESLPQVLTVDGLGDHLIMGVGLGVLVGLLSDLVSKEDYAPTGLLYLLGGTMLVGSGFASSVGLEPLLVGAVAGIWLINATLRRLDILHVLDRGHTLTQFALPFAVGWLLGAGLPAHGVDVEVLVFILVVVLAFRPLARLGGAKLLVRVFKVQGRSRERQEKAEDLLALDDIALVIAAALYTCLPRAAGLAAVVGVMVGQVILGMASSWLEVRRPNPSAKSK
jgi:hypothetical protein